MRLNKYLALCGLGSRRAVEQRITEGQVALNGQVTSDLATQVDETRDTVTVEGRPVHPVARRDFEYILLNKPHGYDVTRGGRHHHRRAWDLLPKDTHASVQSVGRLDRDSTGLLLFTNDGDLAFRLTHPRYGCRKVYEIEVEKEMAPETLQQLRTSVELEDGPAHAFSLERLPSDPEGYPLYKIVMEEGRNRIVRRMCEAVGHTVISLNRTTLGPLSLGTLPRGKTRPLTHWEVKQLRKAVDLAGPAAGETENLEKRRPGRESLSPGRRPAGRGRRPAAGPAGRSRPTERAEQPERRTDRPPSRPERPYGKTERTSARPERPFGKPDRASARPERPFGKPERTSARPERPYGKTERTSARAERPFGKTDRPAPAPRPGRPQGRPQGRKPRP